MARKKEETFASDKDLEDIVNEVIEKNPSILLDIKLGIRPAIDKVVTEVMRKSSIKTDPNKIKNIILSKL